MSAPMGVTSYSLPASLAIPVGNRADGRRFWVANVDAANAVTVTVGGSNEGVRVYELTKTGDSLDISLGDVTMVTIEASAYPTLVGYGELPPGFALATGAKR